MNNYTFFTDGAYSPLRKQIGIGLVLLKNDKKVFEFSKMYEGGTNNKAELGAVIVALRLIINPIDTLTIYTDSQYVIGGATLGWQRNKNIKMWKEFDKQMNIVSKLCSSIKFKHVKGHQKDNSNEFAYWNNYVDSLARNASQQCKLV